MPPTKDDNNGLLSKVVKFVRNPTTNWSDLDTAESDRESSYSKQMLKEMIERKRRNDFVRKREFDMLRKMRRSEVMAGNDPTARPSFFQSSMPSRPDDRASTLKKIDEIEAQMSMQWWKTKHGETSTRTGIPTNFPASAHVPPDALGRPAAPVPGQAAGPALQRTPPVQPPPLAAGGRLPPVPMDPLRSPTMPQPAAPRAAATQPQPQPPRAAAPQPVPPRPAGPQPVPPAQPRVTAPQAVQPPQPMQPRAAAPAPAPAAARPAVPQPPAAAPAAKKGGAESTPGPASSNFSVSRAFAVDVEELAHDPELEEAAIRFANGDDAGAEAGLQEVLKPGGSRIGHEDTWLALFDLYRATGRQAPFDEAAIEFANRFGRSSPQWLSLPEAVSRIQSSASAPPANSSAADWTCPSTLGTQTLVVLQATLARAQQPWRLSWAKLVTIEEAAVEGLTRLFNQWATQPLQLRFIAADNLERVLQAAAPSGDKAVNPAWWKLRMEALRVMHRPDEFELAALDYCVTYEVSPPSWDAARCACVSLQADGSFAGGNTIIGEAHHDSVMSGMSNFGDTGTAGPSSLMSNIAMVELSGSILGDPADVLGTLEGRMAGADVMVISCAQLIRIDFSAAGTLLNWVTARQAEGRQVQFVEVHRLVAAFFDVIGISQYARVGTRRD
ncbi:STAS domain-containing protein [Ramlibacter tataouinensis]|uniref:MlaB-like STAS domain-containing protein n=1 Tax=Ramlibacter tataouinensis (strain ATCC BAA-407 / DSM 14655 / LMG 21543 / TTB310) TaxID=365046 RepID=F5XZL3_RAMTT|nr:STAS domain-containing protein [Ramlibacter tataouinensis]AEG92042.1 conserved hypothetical protein [Ramlibacter tataouinensis TTB310]